MTTIIQYARMETGGECGIQIHLGFAILPVSCNLRCNHYSKLGLKDYPNRADSMVNRRGSFAIFFLSFFQEAHSYIHELSPLHSILTANLVHDF